MDRFQRWFSRGYVAVAAAMMVLYGPFDYFYHPQFMGNMTNLIQIEFAGLLQFYVWATYRHDAHRDNEDEDKYKADRKKYEEMGSKIEKLEQELQTHIEKEKGKLLVLRLATSSKVFLKRSYGLLAGYYFPL
jgi:hypothetical protein